MDGIESIRMAWRSIRGHRLRSALTTLGVIIGVAAVITFVALGASLQAAVIGDIAGGQSPSMTVLTQSNTTGGGFGTGQPVFTEHDSTQIQAIDGVETVIPTGQIQLAGISAHNQSIPLPTMVATAPPYFQYQAQGQITAGQNFTPGTQEVILNDVAATLFATNVTPGDEVTINPSGRAPINATVVGIFTPDSGLGFFGGGSNQPLVYGPTDPFYQTLLVSPGTGDQQRVYPQLTVVATDYTHVDTVADRVETYLDTDSDARQLLPPAYDIEVITNEEFVDQIQSVLDTFTGFITGIAVISLVVGAIGIANIMLVSVTERTREIGIMKAVGFQNRDILQLFLIEAVILGVLGSVVGILVGIVAGLYPAWDGARVDPIEALRYE